jgi:hypothetical protein
MRTFISSLIIGALFFSSCSVSKQPGSGRPVTINSLQYLGQYEIPFNQQFKGTTIGGLSGIDYDSKNDLYYIISDDRSDINPSRFYKAKIRITSTGISNVTFEDVITLRGKNGMPFTPSKTDRQHAVDPEGIRYDPRTGHVVWTSEGERYLKKDTVLQAPSINIIGKDGKYLDTFPLPWQIKVHEYNLGVRQNGVFEGLSFAGNYKTLYVNIEEPLYEDGPRAGLEDADAWIRILKYKTKGRQPLAQYAYRLEPVAHPPKIPGEFIINGVPDILSIGKRRLLVIERSFSTGIQPCTIRVFITDLKEATDISGITSLTEQSFRHPASKKLLINMDDLGIYIDNIEGVTFGPDLPNGHKTLLFVSDNNFAKEQKTQFLLFEIL